MRHFRFTTEEHSRTDVTGEMTAYYEVAGADRFTRSLELYADGMAYSYDLEHPADASGFLPDAEMDAAAAAEVGTIAEISASEFERIWRETEVTNR